MANSHCIAISEFTRRDILLEFGQKYQEKVDVVYNGNRNLNSGGADSQHLESVPDRFVLYVGDRRVHKNLEYTIRVIQLANSLHDKKIKLVIAGSPKPVSEQISQLISDDDSVIAVENVSDEALSALYEKCEALILLSRYEGFGLPVVEAAQRSKKVITLNSSALTEVCPPW